MIKTYTKLKTLNKIYFSKIKNKEIKFLLGGLFLTSDISKFRGFYGNHYLIESLNMSTAPSYLSLLNILKLLGKKKILISFDKKIKINFAKKEIDKNYLIDLKKATNDYVLDNSFHLKKIDKDIINGQKKLINIINAIYKDYSNKLKKNSLIEKKYNFFYPTQKMLNKLKKDGYLIIPNFFKKKSLNEMKNVLIKISAHEKRINKAYMYGKNSSNQRIYNLLSKHKCFRDFLDCSFMYELLNKIYDRNTYHEKFGLSSMAAHIIPPGGEALPLHIDSVVPEPIPKWMIRFITIITLSDFTKNNGSTVVVPKTHKLLRKPNIRDHKKFKEIVLTAPKGSLIMWDGLLWHRSSENASEKSRLSIIVSYAASFFKEICGEEEHLEVVPKKIKKILNPKLRYMIGLDRGIKKGAKIFN